MRLLLIISLLLPSLAWGADVTLTGQGAVAGVAVSQALPSGVGAVAGNNWGNSTKVQWDANTELDLAGYKLYYSCDKVYPPYNGTQSWRGVSPVDVGNVTTHTLTGLNADCEYWSAAVTAYNTTGLESGYSNIITWEFDSNRTRHLAVGTTAALSLMAPVSAGAGSITGTGTLMTNYAILSGIGTRAGMVQHDVLPLPTAGSTGGAGTLMTNYAILSGQGSVTGNVVYLPKAFPEAVGSVAGIYDIIATGKANSFVTAQGSLAGIGTITADALVKETFGQGAIAGIGNVRTLNALYVDIKVIKKGNGSVYVSGTGIDCGSTCDVRVGKDTVYTLTWSKDETESDVYSWGNACLSAERNTTCTIPTDMAGQRMYVESDGFVRASISAGRFGEPICRTGRGTASVVLQKSLQAAYDEIANGRAANPIDCIIDVGDGPLVMNFSANIELVGGWTDFFPGQISAGTPTNINGGLTIKYGTFTIGSYNGAGAVVIR